MQSFQAEGNARGLLALSGGAAYIGLASLATGVLSDHVNPGRERWPRNREGGLQSGRRLDGVSV